MAEAMVFHPDMLPVTREVAAQSGCPVVLQIVDPDGDVTALGYQRDDVARAERCAARESQGGSRVQMFWYSDKPQQPVTIREIVPPKRTITVAAMVAAFKASRAATA